MKRYIDINDISDGRLYTANDMVKADCHDCKGCSACCRGMGSSIILDPMDVWQMSNGLQMSFSKLMEKDIELHVVDGMILPNLRMDEEGEACAFLNEEGRCSIHRFRPGICRLFPLGRYYEDQGFRYFLQIHECSKTDRSKIKVKKWIDMPDFKVYEQYIKDWHAFLADCEKALADLEKEQLQVLNLYVLKTFYQTEYLGDGFYKEFYRRLENARKTFKI